MPAGDLITADEQFEYNALLGGVGTDLRVVSFNLEGLDYEDNDVDFDGADGAASGPQFREPRYVTAELEVIGADNLDAIRSAMRPQALPIPLVISGYLRGSELDPRFLFAKPARAPEFVYNRRSKLSPVVAVTLRWKCTDPLIYGPAETVVLDPGETVTVTNAGDTASEFWAAAFATGPVGAKLLHEGGQFIDFQGHTMAAALTATSRSETGRDWAVRTGAGVRVVPLPILETSEFFELPPGESDLTFTKDSGTDGTCTFVHRSAWS